jgi:hypothetical protein
MKSRDREKLHSLGYQTYSAYLSLRERGLLI